MERRGNGRRCSIFSLHIFFSSLLIVVVSSLYFIPWVGYGKQVGFSLK